MAATYLDSTGAFKGYNSAAWGWTFTPPDNTDCVIACFSGNRNTTAVVTGVTYNTSVMTLIAGDQGGGGGNVCFLSYFISNPSTAASTIVFSWSGAMNWMSASIIFVSNTDGTSPIGTTVVGSSIVSTITAASTNNLIIGFAGSTSHDPGLGVGGNLTLAKHYTYNVTGYKATPPTGQATSCVFSSVGFGGKTMAFEIVSSVASSVVGGGPSFTVSIWG